MWRVKFRVAGKEKLLSLGGWPEIGLATARKERDRARELLAAGADPSRERQQAKLRGKTAAGNTFAEITTEYCDKRKRDGDKAWAPATATRNEYLLGLLRASIGKMPIGEIQPADALAALRRIESSGRLETAGRCLQLASQVFRYAVATARLASDPTRDLRGALTTPKTRHFSAITEAQQAGELLRAIDGFHGAAITRYALQLAPHVFVRPGELRAADWQEIDLDGALWTIPAERMKMRRAHKVPLSKQAIAILRDLYEITGPAGYVFPSIRTRLRPMSENTLNAALRRLGYGRNPCLCHIKNQLDQSKSKTAIFSSARTRSRLCGTRKPLYMG